MIDCCCPFNVRGTHTQFNVCEVYQVVLYEWIVLSSEFMIMLSTPTTVLAQRQC